MPRLRPARLRRWRRAGKARQSARASIAVVLSFSFRDHSFQSTRNERGDVGHDGRQRESAGRGKIARLPLRRELLLVGTKPAKVIEMLAVPKYERTDAVPDWRERTRLNARQG